MKINSLQIDNFRGIRSVSLTQLGDGIVIAGPNGCGKSCILDAVRLLKSAYGSYEQDEWQKWMQESQITLGQESSTFVSLFQDKDRELKVQATFEISESERSFIQDNLLLLLKKSFWTNQFQNIGMMQPRRRASLAENQRKDQAQLNERIAALKPQIQEKLSDKFLFGRLEISPTGNITILENTLLEFIFATYDPENLGIIDYYGANRRYGRSSIGPINLSLENSDQQRRQSALYGTDKAGNLKGEITSSYIRDMLSRASRGNSAAGTDDPLTASLKELFSKFFPGKEFLGPRPTEEGGLTFPVKLENGTIHDIDELSSGEKEIVYGYLRIYSGHHVNSVIIIDEPELHLNPRLTSGLVDFYYKKLAAEQHNQMWLVTHSDAIIREAVLHPSFDVFHLQSAQSFEKSQCTAVIAVSDVDRLIFDLVGDMAAYRPGSKIVVLESNKNVEFDKRVLERIFPEFSRTVNYLSAGSRDEVLKVHETLDSARSNGLIHADIFAIGDMDSEHTSFTSSKRFVWDVYHIENYLLSPSHILEVLQDSGASAEFQHESDILEALRLCAKGCAPRIISHEVRMRVGTTLDRVTRFGMKPIEMLDSPKVFDELSRIHDKFAASLVSELSGTSLQAMISETEIKISSSLLKGDWIKKIPGREILSQFAGKHVTGMSYHYFRDLIISSMVRSGYQPEGMSSILSRIAKL